MTKNKKKKIYIIILVILIVGGCFLGKDEIAFHFSLNKAFYYMEHYEYQQAVTEYTSLIKQKPEVYELYINKAVALANLEQYDDALKTFKQAENINSMDPELYYNLAHLYDIMGEKELEQECLDKGTELTFEANTKEE